MQIECLSCINWMFSLNSQEQNLEVLRLFSLGWYQLCNYNYLYVAFVLKQRLMKPRLASVSRAGYDSWFSCLHLSSTGTLCVLPCIYFNLILLFETGSYSVPMASLENQRLGYLQICSSPLASAFWSTMNISKHTAFPAHYVTVLCQVKMRVLVRYSAMEGWVDGASPLNFVTWGVNCSDLSQKDLEGV